MKDIWIRQARTEDAGSIAQLNTDAFGGQAEAAIVEALAASGDSLYSLIAHDDASILGHIQFFRIRVDGADVAAGLGPMSVLAARQRSGIGSGLVRFGLRLMQGAGRSPVFVLGHPAYYPRFGFAAETAAPFEAPWSGAGFKALRFDGAGPETGALTYPSAFGA